MDSLPSEPQKKLIKALYDVNKPRILVLLVNERRLIVDILRECVKRNSKLKILNTAENAHLVLLKFFITNEKNQNTQSPCKLLTAKKLK